MYKTASSVFMDGVGSTINQNIYQNIQYQKILSVKNLII